MKYQTLDTLGTLIWGLLIQTARNKYVLFLQISMIFFVLIALLVARSLSGGPIDIKRIDFEPFHPIVTNTTRERYNKIAIMPGDDPISSLLAPYMTNNFDYKIAVILYTKPDGAEDDLIYLIKRYLCFIQIIYSQYNDNTTGFNIRFPPNLRSTEASSLTTLSTWRTFHKQRIFEEFDVTKSIDDYYTTLPGYYSEGFIGVLSCMWKSLLKMNTNRARPLIDYYNIYESDFITIQGFPRLAGKFDVFYYYTSDYFALFIMLIFMMSFLVSAKEATDLKATYMQYMFQLIGIPLRTIFMSRFLYSLGIILVIVSLTVIVFKIPIPFSFPILPNSNWAFLFLFLFLYGFAMISITFVFVSVFNNPRASVGISGLYYIITLLPLEMTINKWETSYFQNHIIALFFPNTAMGFGSNIIYTLERYNTGMSWSNLLTISPNLGISLAYIFLCFIIQISFNMLLASYVTQVNFHNFGLKRKWNYVFRTEKSEKKLFRTLRDVKNFEKISNKVILIQVRNLQQIFEKKEVLHDINIDIYKHGVTTILGENGCGKTTFTFIIAAMLQSTRGEIYVNKKNVFHGYLKLGVTFGYCPQYPILTEEFTIYEELYLGCRLRGFSKTDAEKEIYKYMNMFKLFEDKHKLIKICSDGIKRKVMIILSFLGDPDIIILDNPSAYLDPISNIALWNLIIEKKKTSTIIMVSYAIDEMELLSDRILLMKDGTFIAGGSPEYLKMLYDAETIIDIEKKNNRVNVSEITKFIRQRIPNIFPRFNLGAQVQYLVPATEDNRAFKIIENDLNTHKYTLGIQSFSIRESALERAYAKAIGRDDIIQAKKIDELTKFRRFRGSDLERNQIEALFLKQYYYMKNLNLVTITKVLLPTLLIYCCLISYTETPNILPPVLLESKIFDFPIILLSCDNNSNSRTRYYAQTNYLRSLGAPDIRELANETAMQYYIRVVETDPLQETNILFGMDFREDGDFIYFNTKLFHSSAISLNSWYSAINYDITKTEIFFSVSNYPLPRKIKEYLFSKYDGKNFFSRSSTMIILALSFLGSLILLVYSLERISGFYHLQISCQVKNTWYWFSAIVFDYAVYVLCIAPVLLTTLIFRYLYSEETEFIGQLFLVMLMFGLPFLISIYISSLHAGTAIEIIYSIIIGLFTGSVVMFLDELADKHSDVIDKVKDYNFFMVVFNFLQGYQLLNFLNIWFNLYSIMLRLHTLTFFKMFCSYKLNDCSNMRSDNAFKFLHEYYCKITVAAEYSACDKAAYNPKYFNYWYGVGNLCLLLMLKTGVDISLLLLFRKIRRTRFWQTCTFADPKFEEPEVSNQKEEIRSYRLISLKREELVFKNLTKYFGSKRVVNGLCLKVQNGKAVCLMGMNGSGTSTTFEMLTHQTSISYGLAFVGGYNLLNEYNYACQKAAITPNIMAFDVPLKIREIVILIAMMRGYSYSDSKIIVQKISAIFRYDMVLSLKSNELCRGTLRMVRNSLVSIGNCPVLLYDNPVIGLDPHNIYRIWSILAYYKKSGRCIIFISQNLKFMQILSDKVGIIVKGNIMSLGPLHEITQKYNSGLHLVIQYREGANKDEILKIKNYINSNFQGAIIKKCDKKNSLCYYVMTSSLSPRVHKAVMENGRKELVITDYAINKANLVSFFTHCYEII